MSFNFGNPPTLIYQNLLDPSLSPDSQRQHFSFSALTPQPFGRSLPSLTPTPIIDALAIDSLMKNFELEPVQCANLHAFIKVTSFSFATLDSSHIHCSCIDEVAWWSFDAVWSAHSSLHACQIVLWHCRKVLCCKGAGCGQYQRPFQRPKYSTGRPVWAH